jgi:16S rRNA C967 or C1407 C5-methylase (RsmB/RsmF family)
MRLLRRFHEDMPTIVRLHRRGLSSSAFFDYFSSQFGSPEEWTRVYCALAQPTRHCALLNPYASKEQLLPVAQSAQEARMRRAFAPLGVVTAASPFQPQEPSSLPMPAYFLDAASLIPPLVLGANAPVSRPPRLLDLCAAPGGKTLAIAFQFAKLERPLDLVSNELSLPRRRRLETTIRACLPQGGGVSVHVTGVNGDWRASQRPSAPRFHPEGGLFDGVLVDAPCSSDRHAIHASATSTPHRLDGWSLARLRRNVGRQRGLLTTAAMLTRDGGMVVYSTCALSDEENDGVVRWALESDALARAGVTLRVEGVTHPVAEELGLATPAGGVMVLPHQGEGWGPLYTCCLRVRR